MQQHAHRYKIAEHTYRDGGLFSSGGRCFGSRACMRGWLGLASGRIQSIGVLKLLDVFLAHYSMINHWFGVVHPYTTLGLLLICNGRLPGLVNPFGRKILQARAMPFRKVAKIAGRGPWHAETCMRSITQGPGLGLELGADP